MFIPINLHGSLVVFHFVHSTYCIRKTLQRTTDVVCFFSARIFTRKRDKHLCRWYFTSFIPPATLAKHSNAQLALYVSFLPVFLHASVTNTVKKENNPTDFRCVLNGEFGAVCTRKAFCLPCTAFLRSFSHIAWK